MIARAYRFPPNGDWRAELELDLTGTTQVRVMCKKGCGAEYLFIYSKDPTFEKLIPLFIEQLHDLMGLCGNHHPGRIQFMG